MLHMNSDFLSFRSLLLMEEVLHHLGCTDPVNSGMNCISVINWFFPDVFHQQYQTTTDLLKVRLLTSIFLLILHINPAPVSNVGPRSSVSSRCQWFWHVMGQRDFFLSLDMPEKKGSIYMYILYIHRLILQDIGICWDLKRINYTKK